MHGVLQLHLLLCYSFAVLLSFIYNTHKTHSCMFKLEERIPVFRAHTMLTQQVRAHFSACLFPCKEAMKRCELNEWANHSIRQSPAWLRCIHRSTLPAFTARISFLNIVLGAKPIGSNCTSERPPWQTARRLHVLFRTSWWVNEV